MEVLPTRLESRRVRFRWNQTPPSFIPDDPFASHFINVLHLLLPEGERWFCDVFRKAEPLITDAKLRDDVRGFVKQESAHAHAHAVLLEHFHARGIDTKPFTDQMAFLFERLLSDSPIGLERYARQNPRDWIVVRVALIAAIEQFTSFLGDWILEAEALDRAGADVTMLDLLRWHGAEEVEHRSVAFDLFQHLSGNYPLRVATMVVVLPALLSIWFRGAKFMLEADPRVSPALRRSIPHLVARFESSARRTGRVPSLGGFLAAAGRYVGRDFHPSQDGTTETALAYLARSPAVRELRASTS